MSTKPSEEELQTALASLQEKQSLLLSDDLRLRLEGSRLYCDVLDSHAGSHRCENEYKVLLENGRRAFEKHPLAALITQHQVWRVVDGSTEDGVVLWQAD